MSGFIDEFMQAVGPEVTRQMSQNLNMDKSTAQDVIPQLVPLILGGLKRQKDTQGGQPRVDHILNKYGNAGVLEDIAGLFSAQSRQKQPDPRLGGLLGDSGVQASKTVANQFNLDSETAMRLIPMLAPIVLGFLTNKRDNQGAGSQGIESLLDRDGDGSILDDVAGFLLGGGGGTQSGGKGNFLGNLLGGLLGGRKR